jgi:hypothetical protein
MRRRRGLPRRRSAAASAATAADRSDVRSSSSVGERERAARSAGARFGMVGAQVLNAVCSDGGSEARRDVCGATLTTVGSRTCLRSVIVFLQGGTKPRDARLNEASCRSELDSRENPWSDPQAVPALGTEACDHVLWPRKRRPIEVLSSRRWRQGLGGGVAR